MTNVEKYAVKCAVKEVIRTNFRTLTVHDALIANDNVINEMQKLLESYDITDLKNFSNEMEVKYFCEYGDT